MEDAKIIELYLSRSPRAIEETSQQYGKLIRSIARNILGNEEDASECENDTYMAVWNSIPPNEPDSLLGYVCRVVKNIALKRYRDENRQKRSGITVALEELENLIPDGDGIEDMMFAKELGLAFDRFVGMLKRKSRLIFICRYWYGDSVKTIAKTMHMSENSVRVQLFRIRKDLKAYLKKEGFYE